MQAAHRKMVMQNQCRAGVCCGALVLVPVLASAGGSESQVVGAAEYQSSPGDPEIFATSAPQESPLGGMRQRQHGAFWKISMVS